MIHNDLTIRQATPDDKPQIKQLWKRVIKKAFEEDPTQPLIKVEHEITFKMDQLNTAFETGKSLYFLAFEDDRLIGTIAYGTPPNRGILKRTGNELIDFIEIGSLYIDPDVQRKGYGKSLLIFILEHLKSKGIKEVCFDSIIESSKRLWRKIFGEPYFEISRENSEIPHMIWVVEVQKALSNIKK